LPNLPGSFSAILGFLGFPAGLRTLANSCSCRIGLILPRDVPGKTDARICSAFLRLGGCLQTVGTGPSQPSVPSRGKLAAASLASADRRSHSKRRAQAPLGPTATKRAPLIAKETARAVEAIDPFSWAKTLGRLPLRFRPEKSVRRSRKTRWLVPLRKKDKGHYRRRNPYPIVR